MCECAKCGKKCDLWDIEHEAFISMVDHQIYCKKCFLELNPQPKKGG
ncbi:MAG: hypothetical protein ACFFDF_08025 [Candidatus Odinarchaeota archaeon]